MLAPPGTGELVFGLHIHEHRLFKSSIIVPPRVRRAWTSERFPSERGLDLARRREVVKTSVLALLAVAVTGKDGFNENRKQQKAGPGPANEPISSTEQMPMP